MKYVPIPVQMLAIGHPLPVDVWSASGQLLLDAMVTRTYPLDQLQDAFSDMHKGLNAKGVIIF